MIDVGIVEEEERVREYAGEWQRLYDAADCEASLSPEWSEALLRTHCGGDWYGLMVLREAGEVVGLIPLCLRKVRKAGLALNTLIPLAEYFNTHSDLLLKQPSARTMRALLDGLFRLGRSWDVFRLNRLVEASPVARLLEEGLGAGRVLPYEVRRAEPSFYMRLSDTYEAFLQGKSANFRSNLRRAGRKLQAHGQVSIRRLADFADVGEAYAVLQGLEEKSWKKAHGTAITATHRQREFYRLLCEGAQKRGRLRIWVLHVDGIPVAYEMGLVQGERYYSVHGSYDQAYSAQHPGTVLMAYLIEELIGEGVREYDWFGEPFAWERRWTDTYRWHRAVVIYNRTARAGVFRVVNRLRAFRERARRRELTLRSPREILPER